MKPPSYKIHLPTGTVITAHNEQELKNILNMNVCRVYQSCQIRIEPVWESRDTGETLDVIRNKVRHFRRSVIGHELDCNCLDCQVL